MPGPAEVQNGAMRPLSLLVLILAMVSCARPAPRPDQVTVIRDYGWDTTVDEPQPAWNPASYQVVVRAAGGFAVLDEGKGRQEYFLGQEHRSYAPPVWIDPRRFVVGSPTNVITTKDGRVVPAAQGVQIVTMRTGANADVRELGVVGYRPRPWQDQVVVQVEDKIMIYPPNGKLVEFGPGFYAEPQRQGPGIAWQETPVYDRDHWTARPALSDLVIRWRRGAVTTIPRAVEPRWTAAGGVIAYQLDQAPPTDGKPWWEGVSCRLVHLKGEGGGLVVIGDDLLHADPHPAWPMLAANDREGRVVLVSLQDGSRRVLAEAGSFPQWSADGRRLLIQETVLAGAQAGRIYLRVYVLDVAGP